MPRSREREKRPAAGSEKLVNVEKKHYIHTHTLIHIFSIFKLSPLPGDRRLLPPGPALARQPRPGRRTCPPARPGFAAPPPQGGRGTAAGDRRRRLEARLSPGASARLDPAVVRGLPQQEGRRRRFLAPTFLSAALLPLLLLLPVLLPLFLPLLLSPLLPLLLLPLLLLPPLLLRTPWPPNRPPRSPLQVLPLPPLPWQLLTLMLLRLLILLMMFFLALLLAL